MPWIASWLPPLHPAGRCGWIPLMPNANVPERAAGRERHAVGHDVVAGRGGRGPRPGRAGDREQELVVLGHAHAMLGQVDVDVNEGRLARETGRAGSSRRRAARRREARRGPTCRSRSSPRPRARAARGSTSTRRRRCRRRATDVHGLRRATIPPAGTCTEHARGVRTVVCVGRAAFGAACSFGREHRGAHRRVLGSGVRRRRDDGHQPARGAWRRDGDAGHRRGRGQPRCSAPQPTTRRATTHASRIGALPHARCIGASADRPEGPSSGVVGDARTHYAAGIHR